MSDVPASDNPGCKASPDDLGRGGRTGGDTTFVCCIEAGTLEEMTVRMIGSLRRWGGRFADAPVIAVTPRRGVWLTSRTKSLLREMNVQHIDMGPRREYEWYHLYNKPVALAEAERHATTPYVGWIDGDMLVVREMDGLVLRDGEDFACCAPDKNIASTGPDDPRDAWWDSACRSVGLSGAGDLPWIDTVATGQRVRLNWNSGVFVYRRATGLAGEYLRCCRAVLDAKVAFADAGTHFTEQAMLGLAMVRLGLRYRALPHSHNFTMEGWGKRRYNLDEVRSAAVLHYHNMMEPVSWAKLLEVLGQTHPAVREWLAPLGPVTPPAALPRGWLITALRGKRSRARARYLASCRLV